MDNSTKKIIMEVRGRDKFAKYKPVLLLLSKFYLLFTKKARIRMFIRHRRTRGMYGLAVRYALLKTIAIKCGDNVSIHPDCYIFFPERMEIGDNVSIHPMCYIDAVGKLSIGDDVSIAHAVTIMTSSHRFDRKDIPTKDQTYDIKQTVIENNVWIGAKATILCGCQIGTGSVIGAGAVVTHNIPQNTVSVGVPAKVIKER